MTLPRLLSAALLATLLAVGAAAFAWRDEAPSGSAVDRRTTSAVTRTAALTVLDDWDRRRAEAWGSSDVAALRRLYTRGSAAGRADVTLLRAYAARGLRVRGMRMQVLASEVVSRRDDRVTVRVTDRLTGAVAVGEDGRRALPRDEPSSRRITLVRSRTGWRVDEVAEERQPAR